MQFSGVPLPNAAVPAVNSMPITGLAHNRQAAESLAQPAPVDSLALVDAVVAELQLRLMENWDNEPARQAGALEYDLARTAAGAGDQAGALEHLERSILAHPMRAQEAQQDPAFDTMRGRVQELVGRFSVLARMRAEESIEAAHAALQAVSAHEPTGSPPARAYLDFALTQFQYGTYIGYLIAVESSAMAVKIGAGSMAQPPVSRYAEASPRSIRRELWQAARRLWQRLPLLVILLTWLFAGIFAGLATLPFGEGAMAEMRRALLPPWGMGLLCMVVVGFIRAIRRLVTRIRSAS